MGAAVTTAGDYEGQRVDEVLLTSDTGVQVRILNWGVSVRDWQVPVAGGMRQVVLGFEEFAPYPEHSPHLGSIAGRVANRIKGASFSLDGKRFDLPVDADALHLHGGPSGIGRRVWKLEPDMAASAARFTLHSPDGDMGYPGAVDFEATYRLDRNRLRLELRANTDRRTPISLVQHQYFNLGTSDDVLDHHVEVAAFARTELDKSLMPTGAILPVPGSQYDFRAGRTLRHSDGAPIGYDINLVLDTGRSLSEPAAVVVAPDDDLTLKLFTDRPGLQVYNGMWTDIAVPGHGGRIYGRYSGLCLEDQMFPDALHNPHFPSIICSPDQPYSHWCEIEIA